MFRNNYHFLAGLLLLCCTSVTSALPDDWQQEMTILSDHAELDRKAGVVIYQGNVVLTQGTMRIESERLLIIRSGNALEKAIAEGTAKQPARYQQQINPGKPLTKAHGQRIDYFAQLREITIQGNARLEQDGNLFSGERILYDMTKETVSASGGTSTSAQGGNENDKQRIKVVIQPQAPAEPATGTDSKPAQEQP